MTGPGRLLAALWLAAAGPAGAQVATDGSLGEAVDIVPEAGEYRITDDLGRYAGENLFHSFATFDVGAGEIASFLADAVPARVIARVTGGDGTTIDGTLRSAIAGADLFLLDSRGVTFGGGSQLDVDGSFYASSADVLRFASGPGFATGDASPDPALSVAAPAAFGFTSGGPAPVTLARSDRLTVPDGGTLSIVGGNVFLLGDADAPFPIDAPGVRVEIASAAGPVDLPVALADFDLESAPPGSLGTVEFSAATVLLSGAGEVPAGSLMIRGGAFVLSGGAAIVAQNRSDLDAVGPIDVAVSGPLRLLGNPQGIPQTLIQSWSRAGGAAGDVLLSGDGVEILDGAQVQILSGGAVDHTGGAPGLDISARLVEIDGGAEVQALALSAGEAPRVGILATEAIAIGAGAIVVAELLGGHSGGPGGISLEAPDVTVSGGGRVSTRNEGDVAGTPIRVRAIAPDGEAPGTLRIQDAGALLVESAGGPASEGGTIDLVADRVVLSDAGRISSIRSSGLGGDVEIDTDHLMVSNAAGRPERTFVSADDGGSVLVEAGLVELLDGGQIITRANGDVPAGTLSVRADRVRASGVDDVGGDDRPAGLFSRALEGASETGSGGMIRLESGILEIENGAEVSASTRGAADAGRVVIDAAERVTVRGGPGGVSLVSASAATNTSTGAGGAIEIAAGLLELRDGGRVSTTTLGSGDAGRIVASAERIEISGVDPLTRANASGFFSVSNTFGLADGGDGGRIDLVGFDTVRISDLGTVSADATGTGIAGDIAIGAGARLEIEDASVTTRSLASASGGNVKLTAREIVHLLDARIETDVLGGGGDGGDVTIDPVHTVLNRSSITARAVEGAGGNILIVTDHYFESGASFLDPSSSLGIDGTVEITSPETDVAGGLAVLPTDFLDASALLERDCAARTERAGSFTVRTRPAPAAPPDALGQGAAGPACEGGTP